MYSLEVGVVFSDDANLDLGGLEVDGEHLAEARDCELHGVVRGQIGALFELQIKKNLLPAYKMLGCVQTFA